MRKEAYLHIKNLYFCCAVQKKKHLDLKKKIKHFFQTNAMIWKSLEATDLD